MQVLCSQAVQTTDTRVIPSSIAIVRGNADINTYRNNELHDGNHSGIEICALGKNKRKLLHYGMKLN